MDVSFTGWYTRSLPPDLGLKILTTKNNIAKCKYVLVARCFCCECHTWVTGITGKVILTICQYTGLKQKAGIYDYRRRSMVSRKVAQISCMYSGTSTCIHVVIHHNTTDIAWDMLEIFPQYDIVYRVFVLNKYRYQYGKTTFTTVLLLHYVCT